MARTMPRTLRKSRHDKHVAEVTHMVQVLLQTMEDSPTSVYADMAAATLVLAGMVATLATRDRQPLGEALDLVCGQLREIAAETILKPGFTAMAQKARAT